jgi:hypothetical protein
MSHLARIKVVSTCSGAGFRRTVNRNLPAPAPVKAKLNMRKSKYLPWLAALGLLASVTGNVLAGGIEVPMQDAKSLGQADAFTAQADDPSAIFYNPAGLGQLKGTGITVGAFYLQPEFRLESTSDGSNPSNRLSIVLPHFLRRERPGYQPLALRYWTEQCLWH